MFGAYFKPWKCHLFVETNMKKIAQKLSALSYVSAFSILKLL